MQTIVELMSLDNRVFTTFIAWSCMLVVKMMLLAPVVGFYRFKTQAFANPEDGGPRNVRFNNDEVERVRRAHRNDMENLLPAFLIGFLYVLIDPSPLFAYILFKIGAIARILHTIFYAIVVVPQPSRAVTFAIHYLITIYMGASILLHLF